MYASCLSKFKLRDLKMTSYVQFPKSVRITGRRTKAKAIESVMPMIYQSAHATSSVLAPHTRNWISWKDLAQDNVVHILEKAIPTYKPRKNIFFSTYAQVLLDRNQVNQCVFYGAQKREFRQLSYDTGTIQGKPASQVIASTQISHSHQNRTISKVDSERAFLPLYRSASPSLRKYLIRWLLQPKVTKFKKGVAFRQAKKEFQELSKLYGFTRELGQCIIENDSFRRELCFKIVCVLRIRTKRKVSQPESLRNSRELFLVPLFCK